MKDGFGDDDGERRTETLTRKKRRSSSTPRNAFFYGLSVIPDNRYLTEWILSVKPRLYADKLLILSDLSVKHPFITDKLSIFTQPYSVICGLRDNKSGKGPSEGLTMYHQMQGRTASCRWTAEQRHSPAAARGELRSALSRAGFCRWPANHLATWLLQR